MACSASEESLSARKAERKKNIIWNLKKNLKSRGAIHLAQKHKAMKNGNVTKSQHL